MVYSELLRALYHAGYSRVERDDRLLDVFPASIREKGIELWEKWPRFQDQEGSQEIVRILRVRLPYEQVNLNLFHIARGQLESLLLNNRKASLDDFELVGSGLKAAEML